MNLGTHLRLGTVGVEVPSLALDFVSAPILSSAVTFSRGSNATLVDSTGNLTFAPANLLLRSQEIAVSPWAGDTSGGTIPTATANAGIAPDGTNTATRLQINRGAGTYSRWQQVTGTLPAGSFVASIWMRTTSGTGVANVGLRNDATGVNCVVTGTWQRFSVVNSPAAVNPSVQILSFTSIPGTDVSADILVWGAQLEPVTYQTTPGTYNATTASEYYGPRFDYDPVTLAPKGLLIEEPRTNLFVNSLVNGVSLATQNVTVTAVPHTISFYGTGTITLSGASVSAVVGTGAYPNRQTLTFTPIAGVLVCTVVGLVQFAQLEVGTFATSFIPTGASPTARAADVATMTGTNFSSWYNQTAGAFVVGITPKGVPTGANLVRFLEVNNGATATDRNPLILATSAGVASTRYQVAGAVQATLDSSASFFAANSTVKIATAYAANDFSVSYGGASVVTDAAGSVSTGATQMTIGYATSGGGVAIFNGHIRQIVYYNRRLPNGVLQRLAS